MFGIMLTLIIKNCST